eukprot:365861-Chlamydomonas_euryale.AAC.22
MRMHSLQTKPHGHRPCQPQPGQSAVRSPPPPSPRRPPGHAAGRPLKRPPGHAAFGPLNRNWPCRLRR